MNRDLIEKQGFVLLEQLSENSSTVIWKAVQTSLDRKVSLAALKPESAANPAEVEHFLKTSRLLAKIKCNSVVSVFDVVSEESLHYAVMEFVDGPTLEESVAKNGPMAIGKLLGVARDVAKGLQELWAGERIVHRNIKGSAIRLDSLGAAKITDFTLAVQINPGEDATAFDGGLIVGTPCFLAPEQVRGARTLSTQAEMYSLGLLLFYLSTGRIPFDGLDVQSVLAEQLNGRIAPPSVFMPSLPPGFSWFLHSLLMKDPNDRPATWDAVLGDIAALQAGGPPAGAIPNDPRPSTIDVSGLALPARASRTRMQVKSAGAGISESQARALDVQAKSLEASDENDIRRKRFALRGVLWFALAAWFAAFFWFRSAPAEKREKLAAPFAGVYERIAKTFRPNAGSNAPEAIAAQRGKPPAHANAQEPSSVEPEPEPPQNLPPRPAAVTRALANALASGDLAPVRASLEQTRTRFRDDEKLKALLAKIPTSEELVARCLKAAIGTTIPFAQIGKPVRQLRIRSVAKGIVYVEANGLSADFPIASLSPDEMLNWAGEPETPEDAAAYCILLLKVPLRMREIGKQAQKCPLLSDAFIMAAGMESK